MLNVPNSNGAKRYSTQTRVFYKWELASVFLFWKKRFYFYKNWTHSNSKTVKPPSKANLVVLNQSLPGNVFRITLNFENIFKFSCNNFKLCRLLAFTSFDKQTEGGQDSWALYHLVRYKEPNNIIHTVRYSTYPSHSKKIRGLQSRKG